MMLITDMNLAGNGVMPLELPIVAIAEDEPDLRDAVHEYLAERGFRVFSAASGAEVRHLAQTARIDVFILDIDMPGEGGLSLARWIRSQGAAGIIFATAAGHGVDRAIGLELGADDYIVKPYALRELAARLKSVLRRVPPAAAPALAWPSGRLASRCVVFGGLTADFDARRVSGSEGRTIDLTEGEFDLLEIFATRPGRLLTRQQLEEACVGRHGRGAGRSIDVRIARLRRKIDLNDSRPSWIRTVRGEGYVFDDVEA